jgi:hypothetical protein
VVCYMYHFIAMDWNLLTFHAIRIRTRS